MLTPDKDRRRSLLRENEALKRKLEEKDHLIKKLRWKIQYLKRKLFGGGQGEKISDDQLQLIFTQLGEALEELEGLQGELKEKEVAGYRRDKKRSRSRTPYSRPPGSGRGGHYPRGGPVRS